MKELRSGYEVETCVELPSNECGEPDYDRAKYRRFDVPTKEQAITLAKRLVPEDKWGSVAVIEFIREPYELGCLALRKEYVSNPEYIDA